MLKLRKNGIIILGIIAVAALVAGFIWQESKKIPMPEVPELPQKPTLEKVAPVKGGRILTPGIVIPCLVLNKEYCGKGKPIYDEEKKLIGLGFNLPEGTKIYAPFDGYIDNSLMSEIFDGVYYGFSIRERGGQEQRNYFNVVGEVKTTIKPEHPFFPEDPERLANEPVQKEQLVAETTGGQRQRIITSAGNYDIVIYFTTYDVSKNLWSQNIDLSRQFFPYIRK